MKLLLAIAAAAVAAALGASLAPDSGASAKGPASSTIAVRTGDRIRVIDTPLACRVVRMSQLGGRVVVDCRRGGPLAGTYGTLLTAREALVVRFESKSTARRVLVAPHHGDVRRCGAHP